MKPGLTEIKRTIWPWIPRSVRRLYQMRTDARYRVRQRQHAAKRQELERLANLPRYTRATTTLLGAPFLLPDAGSFLYMYSGIMENRVYEFRPTNPAPRIIDGGANIGLSVIFFKQRYPACQLLAFEPDPEIFDILTQNCKNFGLKDVELTRKALWTSETTLSFQQEGADAGRLDTNHGATGPTLSVPTVRLRDLLEQPVDLLKLDVEGVELELLEDCQDVLRNVEHLFVEYHSFADRPQTLSRLTQILDDAGFRIHIQANLPSKQPFLERKQIAGFDLLLEIWAFREASSPGPLNAT